MPALTKEEEELPAALRVHPELLEDPRIVEECATILCQACHGQCILTMTETCSLLYSCLHAW